jgi:hypothetical protein
MMSEATEHYLNAALFGIAGTVALLFLVALLVGWI